MRSATTVFHSAHFSRTVCLLSCLASIGAANLWGRTGDQNNGHYSNPILFSDYSDPDVIRVGKSYYLVASSFHFMPGIPVLESHDLVNWHIIAHVFPRLDIDRRYDMEGGDRYGDGETDDGDAVGDRDAWHLHRGHAGIMHDHDGKTDDDAADENRPSSGSEAAGGEEPEPRRRNRQEQ